MWVLFVKKSLETELRGAGMDESPAETRRLASRFSGQSGEKREQILE